MRIIFSSVTLLLLASWTHAAPHSEALKATLERQPNCGKLVRFDDNNLYQGFGTYRKAFEEPREALPGKLRVAPIDGSESFELSTNDGVVDVITEGKTAFVLTYSSIEIWNLTEKKRVAEVETYAKTGPKLFKEHATSFARYNDVLIISHGRLGVSFFNMKTQRLVNQFRLLKWQLPYESMATGVTVQGKFAYVVMDNFHITKPGDGLNLFRGLIVINMETQQVVSELGGMDPGADAIVSHGNTLLVSFWGMPIWKYKISNLKGNSIPEPVYRLFSFPVKGHPTGSPAMDDRYYYTCYLKAPAYRGENGGMYKNVPLALDKLQLMMD